ncbi:hypothetical protein CsSME_00020044 [Camellia sinensis var. sinensis]
MAAISSMTPLNRSVVETSKSRNPEATTSNRSINERLSSAAAPTRFFNQVTRSLKASIPDTIYEQSWSDTNCHNTIFGV